MTSPSVIPDASYSTKNRIAAVDIMRILAAFVVMYEHFISSEFWFPSKCVMLSIGLWGAMSGIFFVLAGFFACRRITWHKAFNNAWWCLAPFVLWNLIYLVIDLLVNGNVADLSNPARLFGVTGILAPTEWGWFSASVPVNNPLWFMRDLVLLFLLSPLLCRFASYLLLGMVMLSIMPETAYWFSHDCGVFCSPYSLSLFCFGCWLGSFGKEERTHMLKFYSIPLVVFYIILCMVIFWYREYLPAITRKPLVASIISFGIFYQLCRIIEVHLPRVADFALCFAPVTFLTFATHMIVYMLLPEVLRQSLIFCLCLPVLIFAGLALLFAWIKPNMVHSAAGRYLLHLVAHYKARPDDFEQRSRASEPAAHPDIRES